MSSCFNFKTTAANRVETVLKTVFELMISQRTQTKARSCNQFFSFRVEAVTFFMPMFPAYRNQSIDLQCTSIDWFLYERNIGMKKVKERICFWSNKLYNFIFEDITAFRASNIRIKHIPFFQLCEERVFEIFIISSILRNVSWVHDCIPRVLLWGKSVKVIWVLFLKYFVKITKFSIPVSLLQRFKAKLTVEFFFWSSSFCTRYSSGSIIYLF